MSDLQRGEKIWWHDPDEATPNPARLGWVDQIDTDGQVGVAEVDVPTVMRPPLMVHRAEQSCPVDGCSYCAKAT